MSVHWTDWGTANNTASVNCKMTIRAIFFDFDGVLTLNERGSTVTIRVIQEANPDLSARGIKDSYYEFHHQLLLGEKDHYGIWGEFCRCVGGNIDSHILTKAFLATRMNAGMIELASELTTNYRLGIITANAVERMAPLVDKYELASLFDPIVISAEVGALKIDALIFENALGGQRPEECVFIDNQEKNLVAPATLGFKTYLFDPKQNDIPRLRSQLVEWGIEIQVGM
ncbi:MAG: HAD hydrolase-like protein [Planctomycetes bacterium]|nr:HAD hydrolase-like protein [Planctomycetota bacterium]